jgi:phosphoribosyl-dephospho-CoA transferase
MLYHALTGSLKGKEGTSKIITIILAAILAIFLIAGFFAKKTANRFLDDFGEEWEQTIEQSGKDLEQSMKELSKELDKATEELQAGEEEEK